MQPEDVDCRSFKDWVLKKETELRLEVENDDTLDIKVYSQSNTTHTHVLCCSLHAAYQWQCRGVWHRASSGQGLHYMQQAQDCSVYLVRLYLENILST